MDKSPIVLNVRYIEKPDCKKIVLEHRQMADTTILNYGDYDVLASPKFYCADEEMDNIFAVPEKNSVGTNDLDNAISLLHFRWTHPDPKQRLVPLLSSAGSIWNSYNPKNNFTKFTFSPDGKWVVFRDMSVDYLRFLRNICL
jgi:hypothetical protein